MTIGRILAQAVSTLISYSPVTTAELAMTDEEFEKVQTKKLKALLREKASTAQLNPMIDYFRNRPTGEDISCSIPELQCDDFVADGICLDYGEFCAVPVQRITVYGRRNCPADAVGALSCMKGSFGDAALDKAITQYVNWAQDLAQVSVHVSGTMYVNPPYSFGASFGAGGGGFASPFQ